jgi:thiol:disulfide interchange protein DsbC
MRWFIALLMVWSLPITADETVIRERILGINPVIQIQSITAIAESPFFEVVLSNGERIYTDAGASHFVAGDLYAVGTGRVTNLTELAQQAERKELLESLDASELVVFEPSGEVAHDLLVFTDIDCGYCRRLHEEIDQLLAGGVRVSYAAFPRAGVDSESFDKYVSVVCADDQQQAMTDAKQGLDPEPRTCANAVEAQFQLGQSLGISGTPTLIFGDGSMQPGYAPAAELLKRMNQIGS